MFLHEILNALFACRNDGQPRQHSPHPILLSTKQIPHSMDSHASTAHIPSFSLQHTYITPWTVMPAQPTSHPSLYNTHTSLHGQSRQHSPHPILFSTTHIHHSMDSHASTAHIPSFSLQHTNITTWIVTPAQPTSHPSLYNTHTSLHGQSRQHSPHPILLSTTHIHHSMDSHASTAHIPSFSLQHTNITTWTVTPAQPTSHPSLYNTHTSLHGQSRQHSPHPILLSTTHKHHSMDSHASTAHIPSFSLQHTNITHLMCVMLLLVVSHIQCW